MVLTEGISSTWRPVHSYHIVMDLQQHPILDHHLLANVNKDARHVIGVDPGFGSSEFGICVLEYSDSIIKVIYADSYERMPFKTGKEHASFVQHNNSII